MSRRSRVLKKRGCLALVCVAAAVVAAPVSTAVAQSQRFPDVPADHYAFAAVEWAAEAGVTAGYGDGTFRPQQPLSKRHAVVFMERYYDEILGADQSEDFTRGDMMVLLKAINDGTLRTGTPSGPASGADGAAQSQRFLDVPVDHYAFAAVEWAAEAGVTAGYGDGTFRPQQPLSKRHAVVFMERYYDEILGADQSEDFTRGDMMVLLKAINDGTLRDTNDGTLRDTSEEVAVFLCGPPDVSAEWAAQGQPEEFEFRPYTDEMLSDVVDLLNERVAPFWSWQSSGTYRLTYVEGDVISIPTEDFWPPFASDHPNTRRDPTFEHCIMSTHPRHSAYIIPDIYNRPSFAHVGSYSVNFTTLSSFRSLHTSRESTGLGRFLGTVAHETDHAVFRLLHHSDYPGRTVGLGLCYGACLHNTTRYFEETIWPKDHHLYAFNDLDHARWNRYVELLSELYDPYDQNRRYFDQGVYIEGDLNMLLEGQWGLWACKRREEHGWPVGDNAPPCVREAPSRPVLTLEQTDAGDVIVDVKPHTDSDGVAVSGYVLHLYESRELDLSELDLSLLPSFDEHPDEALSYLYDSIDAFLPRQSTRYAKGESYDVHEVDPYWAVDSVIANSELSRYPAVFLDSRDDTQASTDWYRTYASVIDELVGETVCQQMECMDLPFIDYRVFLGISAPGASYSNDDYDRCERRSILCFQVVTHHLSDVDDFPYTLVGLTPGTRYLVQVSAWSRYGVGISAPGPSLDPSDFREDEFGNFLRDNEFIASKSGDPSAEDLVDPDAADGDDTADDSAVSVEVGSVGAVLRWDNVDGAARYCVSQSLGTELASDLGGSLENCYQPSLSWQRQKAVNLHFATQPQHRQVERELEPETTYHYHIGSCVDTRGALEDSITGLLCNRIGTVVFTTLAQPAWSPPSVSVTQTTADSLEFAAVLPSGTPGQYQWRIRFADTEGPLNGEDWGESVITGTGVAGPHTPTRPDGAKVLRLPTPDSSGTWPPIMAGTRYALEFRTCDHSLINCGPWSERLIVATD